MLINCPRCDSVFKLPDSDNLQQKMRCSVCNNVFKLGEAIKQADDVPIQRTEKVENYQVNTGGSFSVDDRTAGKKNSVVVRIILILLFLGLAACGILMKFTTYLDPIKGLFSREKLSTEQPKETIESLYQRIQDLQITNVRQFVVPNSENDKFEKLTVIEGVVINRFDTPRSFIELEASLYDADKNLIESKTQMAGPRVSIFQLQVQGKEELEQALRDNIYILNYNTNIPPNGSVPFMFIFYNPPEDAVNFNIKIINAQIPQPEENENSTGN